MARCDLCGTGSNPHDDHDTNPDAPVQESGWLCDACHYIQDENTSCPHCGSREWLCTCDDQDKQAWHTF